jgi:hypothetical protein
MAEMTFLRPWFLAKLTVARPWYLTHVRERMGMAWRAFQGDHWVDPQHVNACNRDMAGGALDAIQRLLDSGGIPRGTFADEQVHNLVVMYHQRGAEIALLRELLPP